MNSDTQIPNPTGRQVTLEAVKKMSDEELRVRIAELRGWKQEKSGFGDYMLWVTPDRISAGRVDGINGLPNYPHDLNAVHEVETSMFAGNHGAYFATLGLIIGQAIQPAGWYDAFLLGTATARQRCEALVLCLSTKGSSTPVATVREQKTSLGGATKETKTDEKD